VTDAYANSKLACGLLLVFGFTSCTSEKVLAPSPQEGRAIYLEACASCHGADGKGDGPAADTLKHRPPDLTRLAERHAGEFPRQFVLDVVAEG
jgi:mono/diheme cytochrome c family protein